MPRATPRQSWSNWAGNQRCQPRSLQQPNDEAELSRLLRSAAERGEPIKAVGAGHSWSDVACTSGQLVNLDRLDRVLHVDEGEVTVQAGIRLKALNTALRRRGLALSCLGSSDQQSLAGAVATGTHGSGARFGSLSTQITGLRLLGADGQPRQLGPADGELFSAARLSLGCLGLITRLTLRCEPAFNLREQSYALPFSEALDRVQALADQHEHLKLWWLPHTKTVQVYAADRSAEAPAHRGALGAVTTALTRGFTRLSGHELQARARADHLVNQRLFPLLLGLGARAPWTTPLLNRAVAAAYFNTQVRIDRSDRVFNVALPPPHRELEYALPRQEAAPALRRLRARIEALGLRVNFVVELRFAAADDVLLSPARGRETCWLGAYMAEAPDLPAYFAAFEALCLELGGRPHWGKEHGLDAAQLRHAFTDLRRFDALRRELDPTGMFENAFTRRVFRRVF